MDMNTLFRNLSVPKGRIDCVLDTDTYNEIDDQFALAYMLSCTEKLNVKAIYAAPFHNDKSESPCDGMHRSYDEILKVLRLMKREELSSIVFKGSEGYLPDEKTAVESEAADHLIALAENYSAESPLYVVAIGAITNIASALLKCPEIGEKIVVVWLGGHALTWEHTYEFNMFQDVASARVIWRLCPSLVQLPCAGVVSGFTVTAPELREYMIGKNELCTYLAENTIEYTDSHYGGKCWSKVVWDVTAVGWLMNDGGRFMDSKIIHRKMPNYDNQYNHSEMSSFMTYVTHIKRDALLEHMIEVLTK